MGKNGKEYVKENYSWPVILRKYRKLFGFLAGKDSCNQSES
jgi:hypothetical protein